MDKENIIALCRIILFVLSIIVCSIVLATIEVG